MAKESPVVSKMLEVIGQGLRSATLKVERGVPLLYQVTVDNNLKVMDADAVRKPRRGTSAFQTDLCIFEDKGNDIWLPRVVLEFKTGITTHDVLTYSVKAQKHKSIYPYLRYGLIASDESNVPGRFFTHNTNLDFCLCIWGLGDQEIADATMALLRAELDASRCLETIAFGRRKTRLFRTELVIAPGQ